MEFAPRGPVPVFPLPDFVLFPRAAAPLHVFELRYRTLVQDALRGDRHIAMALLKPGWERDYHGSPEFHPLGCLARFQEVQWLPDDCYDIRVVGVARVRFGRVEREYPYRTVRVSVLPQEPHSEDDPLIELERQSLLDAWTRSSAAVTGAADPRTAFEDLVNAACMECGLPAEIKLGLLEIDSVIERARRVREALEQQVRRSPSRPGRSGEHN